MAKLHDFDRSGEWDLIVVDTPPTAHALDFLDAPRKLSEAIDSPAIDWFRKLQGGGGSRLVARRQDRRVRPQAAREVRRQQVHRRPRRVLHRVQRHPRRLSPARRGDVRAAAPAARRLRAGREPRADGGARGARVPRAADRGGDAVRRLRRQQGPSVAAGRRPTRRAVEAALAAHAGVAALGLSGTTRTMAAQALLAAHAEIETLAAADRTRDRPSCATAGGAGALLVEVPLLRDDVHDVDRLVGLERFLLAG